MRWIIALLYFGVASGLMFHAVTENNQVAFMAAGGMFILGLVVIGAFIMLGSIRSMQKAADLEPAPFDPWALNTHVALHFVAMASGGVVGFVLGIMLRSAEVETLRTPPLDQVAFAIPVLAAALLGWVAGKMFMTFLPARCTNPACGERTARRSQKRPRIAYTCDLCGHREETSWRIGRRRP